MAEFDPFSKEGIEDLERHVLTPCAERGMKAPFIVCCISRNAAALMSFSAVGDHFPKPVGGAGHGRVMEPMTIMVIDGK